MANTIKIKAGSGTPTTSNIVDRELAFDRSANKLYINDNGSIVDLSGEVGDITAVTAGTGLDGGGSSGDVTLSVDVSDFMSNGSNDRILTATGTDAMNAEANLTFSPSNNYLTVHEAGASTGSHLRLATDNSDFILSAGGGTNQLSIYDVNAAANRLVVNSSGTFHFQHHVTLPATKKLYLDGGSDTYIHNPSGDTIDFVAGGQQMLRLFEGGTDYVHVDDNTRLGVGNDPDLTIYHTSDQSYISNSTGRINVQNQAQDQDIRFSVNDGGVTSNILTLNAASSRVGINDTSPSYALDVTGDIRATGDLRASDDIVLDVNANYLYSRDASGTLTRMFGMNSGNTTYIGPIDAYAGGSVIYGISSNVLAHYFYTDGAIRMKLDGPVLDIPNTGDWSSILNNTNSGGLRFGSKDAGGTLAYQIEISNTGNYVKLNEDVQLLATKKLFLDGGGSTYITETAGDLVDMVVGGVTLIRFEESGTDSVFTNDNVQLGVGVHKDFVMYHDGTHNYAKLNNGNLYFRDESNNNILIVYREGNGLQLTEGDFTIPGTSKLRLDGATSGDTYIHEPSANQIGFVTGGNTRLLILPHKTYINSTGANGLVINNDEGNTSDSGRIFFEGTSTTAIMQQGNDFSIRSGATTGSSSGTERFLVNTSGATVVGNLNVTGNSFMNYGLVVNETANDADFRVEGTSDTHLLLTDAANNRVGIGVASPGEKLDVKSQINVTNSNNDSMVGLKGTNFGYSTSYRALQIGATSGNYSIALGYDPSTNASPQFTGDGREVLFRNGVEFTTPNSANNGFHNDVMVLKDGNVGIGVASPGEKLEVSGNIKTTAHLVLPYGEINDAGTDLNIVGTNAVTLQSSAGTALTIPNASTNVGIGTGSPSFKLKVNVDNGTYTSWETIAGFQAKRSADSETEAGIMINSLGDALGGQISSNWYWSNNTGQRANTGRSSGVFGIANSTTTYSEFYWQVTPHNSNTQTTVMELDGATSTLHVDGDVVAYSTTVSDKRLKDNVETIDNALSKVMKLRGVEFDWIGASRKGQHDIGLIAQEVEEVIPEIVREKEFKVGEFTDNKQTFKTVDYDKMVGVLIEAIKEQQKQINKLEEKLNG